MAHERKVPLSDFIQSTAPAGKKSKLLDYWDEIQAARAQGYTYAQICAWLAQNGVVITIQGIAKFIKTQTQKEEERRGRAGSRKQDDKDISRPHTGSKLPATAIGSNSLSGPKVSPTEKRARRDRTAALFIRDDKNSVLENIKDTKE